MHRYHIMTNKNNVCSLKNMIMQNRTFSLATMKTLTCITNKLVGCGGKINHMLELYNF